MNKYIEWVAKMIMVRSDVARAGATATKSDYLEGRADEGEYILDQIKYVFPDEVASARASLTPTPTTISG